MSMSPTGQPSRTTSANATGRETALRSAICCAGSIPNPMFVWVTPRDLRSVIPAGNRGGMAAAEVFTLIGLATVALLGVVRWWEEHSTSLLRMVVVLATTIRNGPELAQGG